MRFNFKYSVARMECVLKTRLIPFLLAEDKSKAKEELQIASDLYATYNMGGEL